ncbi:MAG TPA: hypothetical protein VNG12_02235 [Acidimicrobiales bacterium]|nr:hypothetical protein [Acidimicrobiales bacterium]
MQRTAHRVVTFVGQGTGKRAGTPLGYLAVPDFGLSDGVADNVGQCVVLTDDAGQVDLAGPESFVFGAVGFFVG